MSDQPLWQAMEAAFIEGRKPGCSDPHGYAAEIRALRDRILPEEDDPSPEGTRSDSFAIAGWYRWHERQRLRALLTAEAERAEKG